MRNTGRKWWAGSPNAAGEAPGFSGSRLAWRAILLAIMVGIMAGSGLRARADGQVDLERFAQWSMQYGSLMLDEGKYLEALGSFESALEATRIEKTRVQALMFIAETFTSFLDSSDDALRTYAQIRENHPTYAETAWYKSGLLLVDQERHAEAVTVLQAYLQRYPQGRFIYQAEFLLDSSRAAVAAPGPTTPGPAPIPQNQQLGDEPMVRVLLAETSKALTLKAPGLTLLLGDRTVWRGGEVKILARNGRVVLASDPNSAWQGEITVRANGPIHLDWNDNERDKSVRGSLRLTPSGGRLRVINHVPMESYLRGVVPAESWSIWDLEALKAQAVAARTYAYYKMARRTREAWDVTDDTRSQAYEGVERETSKTDRAVSETAGQLLTQPGNNGKPRPILTMYSANSGGHTADPRAVFRRWQGAQPYLIPQADPWSMRSGDRRARATWERRHTVAAVTAALADKGIRVTNLRAIEPAQTGPSGRWIKVRFLHDGPPVEIRARPFLSVNLKLYDTLLTVRREGDEFIFDGRGFGHGVGYMQWGAAAMATAGKSHHEILTFYYPGVDVTRMW